MTAHDPNNANRSARRLPWALSEKESLIVRRLREIDQVHCINGNVLLVDAAFEKFMRVIESTCFIDGDSPEDPLNEREGYALVITAPSYAGKSHVLKRIAKDHRLQPRVEDDVPRFPLLKIDAPSPCVLRTLGLEILRTLDPALTNPPEKIHLIWHAVRKLFIAHSVLILQINEFHNVMIGRKESEIEELVTALKAVMVGTTIVRPPHNEDDRVRKIVADQGELYPVFLILAGTPSLQSVTKNRSTEHFEQFSRRCEELAFEDIPVRRGSSGRREFVGMPEFLEMALREMGFDPDPQLISFDMQKRFYKASVRQYGRVMWFMKKAAELAVLEGKGGKPGDYLATAFEKLYETGPASNCFLVADIDACPTPPDPRPRRA